MRLPKQRAVHEQRAESGILRQHQHFGGAQRKRTKKDLRNNSNSASPCPGSQGVEGLREKGMVLEPIQSLIQADGTAYRIGWPGHCCCGVWRAQAR